MKNKQLINSNDEKYCKGCKSYLKVKYFTKHLTAPTKLDYYCTFCKSKLPSNLVYDKILEKIRKFELEEIKNKIPEVYERISLLQKEIEPPSWAQLKKSKLADQYFK
jgi:hypothetical protein